MRQLLIIYSGVRCSVFSGFLHHGVVKCCDISEDRTVPIFMVAELDRGNAELV